MKFSATLLFVTATAFQALAAPVRGDDKYYEVADKHNSYESGYYAQDYSDYDKSYHKAEYKDNDYGYKVLESADYDPEQFKRRENHPRPPITNLLISPYQPPLAYPLNTYVSDIDAD